MRRLAFVITICVLCAGCSTVTTFVQAPPTVITDNMGSAESEDDRVITVAAKGDALIEYELTEKGYKLKVDNRGRKSFGRELAEKMVEKADVVIAPGVESVGAKE